MNIASFHSRIRVISFFIFLFACVLIGRLFFVQIVYKDRYDEKADKQYASSTLDTFERGDIFFSKKDKTLVSAASVMSGFKVAIKPKDIKDAEAVFKSLESYTTLTHDEFINKASKKNDPYEEVAVNLTREDADIISALRLPGVSIYKQNWRFYPGGSMAAHSLGFLAFKGDTKVGQYGLERSYNEILARPASQSYVNFFAEVFSNLGEIFSSNRQGNIVTTINPEVQYNLESEMKKTFNLWNGDQVGGIIMDPKTGEIYAISAMPDFDLNQFSKVEDKSTFANPMVENVLEFGSVIKPLVMSAALDKGVVTPETSYNDAGFVTVDKKQMHNFDKKGRGLSTMQTVLDQSLNTGMVFVENKLGHDAFRTYMKNYGIGEKTGIDLPNETHGLIANLDSPRNIEYANAAFGQGIALTPIGAVRAFASLANGGNLVIPHLVKEIKYDDGTSKTLDFPPTRTNLLKKETTDTITRMLVHVFESYGNGSYKLPHYSVASKTGTAQVAQDNGKGYYEDRHTHSFFGYFPAYDPQFIVFMYIKNPKGVNYASQTLLPPFVNITKFLLNYYNIPPDR